MSIRTNLEIPYGIALPADQCDPTGTNQSSAARRKCPFYDNEAALNSHRNSDHFKKFQATTANMVSGRNVRAMSLIAFNSKGH